MRTFHLKEAARKWAFSRVGKGTVRCGVAVMPSAVEACSHASQKHSSITFKRWECKLVTATVKTSMEMSQGEVNSDSMLKRFL